jgi:hypothetical protein
LGTRKEVSMERRGATPLPTERVFQDKENLRNHSSTSVDSEATPRKEKHTECHILSSY